MKCLGSLGIICWAVTATAQPEVPLSTPPLVSVPLWESVRSVPAPLRSKPKAKAERNQVSMAGAPSLGAGGRGQWLFAGFPFLGLRLLFGVTDRLDLGLGVDSYYFVFMNQPLVVARLNLLRNERWALAATFEGGYAFFSERAARETRGARWLTGRRNINFAPALVGSFQGLNPRAGRIFAELRYLGALDTEPVATEPLGGVPPPLVLGHNVGLKGGAEFPLSAKTSFVFVFGIEVHGRSGDLSLLPTASLGVVTSL